MSNYPPYQMQPYSPQFGPYTPQQPFPTRPDMTGPGPMMAAPNQQQLPQGGVIGLSPSSRPVTSKEEAMGVAADFSGALMLFPDITHNRIYVKRWDVAAGGPAFQEYAPVLRPAAEPEPKQQDPQQAVWATLEDVQNLQDVVQQLQDEINRLKKPAAKGGTRNDPEK